MRHIERAFLYCPPTPAQVQLYQQAQGSCPDARIANGVTVAFQDGDSSSQRDCLDAVQVHDIQAWIDGFHSSIIADGLQSPLLLGDLGGVGASSCLGLALEAAFKHLQDATAPQLALSCFEVSPADEIQDLVAAAAAAAGKAGTGAQPTARKPRAVSSRAKDTPLRTLQRVRVTDMQEAQWVISTAWSHSRCHTTSCKRTLTTGNKSTSGSNSGALPCSHMFVQLVLWQGMGNRCMSSTLTLCHLASDRALSGWQRSDDCKNASCSSRHSAAATPSRSDAELLVHQQHSLQQVVAELANRQADTSGVAKPVVAARSCNLAAIMAPLLAGNTCTTVITAAGASDSQPGPRAQQFASHCSTISRCLLKAVAAGPPVPSELLVSSCLKAKIATAATGADQTGLLGNQVAKASRHRTAPTLQQTQSMVHQAAPGYTGTSTAGHKQAVSSKAATKELGSAATAYVESLLHNSDVKAGRVRSAAVADGVGTQQAEHRPEAATDADRIAATSDIAPVPGAALHADLHQALQRQLDDELQRMQACMTHVSRCMARSVQSSPCTGKLSKHHPFSPSSSVSEAARACGAQSRRLATAPSSYAAAYAGRARTAVSLQGLQGSKARQVSSTQAGIAVGHKTPALANKERHDDLLSPRSDSSSGSSVTYPGCVTAAARTNAMRARQWTTTDSWSDAQYHVNLHTQQQHQPAVSKRTDTSSPSLGCVRGRTAGWTPATVQNTMPASAGRRVAACDHATPGIPSLPLPRSHSQPSSPCRPVQGSGGLALQRGQHRLPWNWAPGSPACRRPCSTDRGRHGRRPLLQSPSMVHSSSSQRLHAHRDARAQQLLLNGCTRQPGTTPGAESYNPDGVAAKLAAMSREPADCIATQDEHVPAAVANSCGAATSAKVTQAAATGATSYKSAAVRSDDSSVSSPQDDSRVRDQLPALSVSSASSAASNSLGTAAKVHHPQKGVAGFKHQQMESLQAMDLLCDQQVPCDPRQDVPIHCVSDHDAVQQQCAVRQSVHPPEDGSDEDAAQQQPERADMANCTREVANAEAALQQQVKSLLNVVVRERALRDDARQQCVQLQLTLQEAQAAHELQEQERQDELQALQQQVQALQSVQPTSLQALCRVYEQQIQQAQCKAQQAEQHSQWLAGRVAALECQLRAAGLPAAGAEQGSQKQHNKQVLELQQQCTELQAQLMEAHQAARAHQLAACRAELLLNTSTPATSILGGHRRPRSTARAGRRLADIRASAASGEGSSNAGQSPSGKDVGSTSGTTSSSGNSWRLSLPNPSFKGASFGIGAGGMLYGATAGKAVALWPFSKKAPVKDKKQKRVLIMMSNTGGGHKASAEAIRDAFKETHGEDYQVSIVDMWKDHTPPPFRNMPDTYSFLVKHSILWRLSYELIQPRWVHRPYLAFCGLFMRRGLNRAFDLYQPDLVVSVHPLMQHVPIGILKHRIFSGRMPATNFATVVTDFTTCHNTWFHTETTRCFVPTEYCGMLARDNGLADEQIVQHGLPIRPIFSKPLPGRSKLRKQLGIDTHLPTVLLVGGGEGMGALEETVKQLDLQLGKKGQVVVICGRNKKLLAKLQETQHPNGLVVHPQGFVNNIHEWMVASDAIITKAGPGTIAEALISGLPILLNGNVPCQEEGNIPYVIDNGVGDFETHPPKIAHIMHQWLLDEQHHKEHTKAMAKRSKELGRPDAVYQIVNDLAALADAPDFSFGPAAVLNRKAVTGNGSQRAPALVAA